MTTEQHPAKPDTTMWTSLLHAGLAGSFLKLPHVAPQADALREHGARAAIYGIPWDSTSISRTGANYGPRGIREISGQFLTYNATWDFDLVEALNPVDCGDCDVVLANAEKTFAHAERDIAQILEAGAVPATLGGDRDAQVGEGAGVAPDGPLVDAQPPGELADGHPAVCLEQLQHREHPGSGGGHAGIIAAIPGGICPVLLLALSP
jgi:hypothetical protein